MKVLSESECRRWCIGKGIPLDEYKRPALFSGNQTKQFPIPEDAGQRMALVHSNLLDFKTRNKILVWITEWSVWPSAERMHIFDRFRASYGINALLIEKPGHLFSTDEFEDAVSLVTLAVLFLWDCYVLVPNGRPGLWYSHDEIGYLLR